MATKDNSVFTTGQRTERVPAPKDNSVFTQGEGLSGFLNIQLSLYLLQSKYQGFL